MIADLPTDAITYLASPYNHPDPDDTEDAK